MRIIKIISLKKTNRLHCRATDVAPTRRCHWIRIYDLAYSCRVKYYINRYLHLRAHIYIYILLYWFIAWIVFTRSRQTSRVSDINISIQNKRVQQHRLHRRYDSTIITILAYHARKPNTTVFRPGRRWPTEFASTFVFHIQS